MKPYKLYARMIPRYYLEPVDASVQIFSVIGNGMEWSSNGEMSLCIRDEVEYKPFSHDCSGLRGELLTRYQLMNEASELKRDFVHRNLKKILRGSKTASHFRSNSRTDDHYVRNPNVSYSLGLNFPDNITKEWATILLDYLEWWTTQLRMAYGVGRSKDEISHWQTDLQNAYSAICQSIHRLYPTVYGQSYEDRQRMLSDMIDKLSLS